MMSSMMNISEPANNSENFSTIDIICLFVWQAKHLKQISEATFITMPYSIEASAR